MLLPYVIRERVVGWVPRGEERAELAFRKGKVELYQDAKEEGKVGDDVSFCEEKR